MYIYKGVKLKIRGGRNDLVGFNSDFDSIIDDPFDGHHDLHFLLSNHPSQ